MCSPITLPRPRGNDVFFKVDRQWLQAINQSYTTSLLKSHKKTKNQNLPKDRSGFFADLIVQRNDLNRSDSSQISGRGYRRILLDDQSSRCFLNLVIKLKSGSYAFFGPFVTSQTASAANLPEVNAQALLAPDGESDPMTPPTTSPAA